MFHIVFHAQMLGQTLTWLRCDDETLRPVPVQPLPPLLITAIGRGVLPFQWQLEDQVVNQGVWWGHRLR